jgi:transcriptional regulator with XRE-family HTH domain
MKMNRTEEGRRRVRRRIGRNLERRRAELDIDRAECAARAGVTISEVATIEAGERQPLSDSILRIAATLDWQVSDLLAGVRWLTPAEDGHDGHFEVDGRQI